MNPQPPSDSLGYDVLSSRLADNTLLELQASGEELDALVRCLRLEDVRNALEVGCGTGVLSRAVARALKPGGRVHGVDLSEEHVRYARRAAREAGLDNVTFEAVDFMKYRQHACFDLIYSRYLLMYFIAKGQAPALLSRMKAFLRPGGRVACIEADINFGQERFPPPPAELADALARIVVHYRQSGQIEWRAGVQLYYHLRQSGFECIQVSLATGRIIQGGRPATLVEHDSQDIEQLVAPFTCVEQRAAISALWRQYLKSEGSFLYTPVFVAVGSGGSGNPQVVHT